MEVTKYGHACLLVEVNGARILIDPGEFSEGFEKLTELDAIMITHQHADHVDMDRLGALVQLNPKAIVYADEETAAQIEDIMKAHVVHEGDEFKVGGVPVEVIGSEHAVIHKDIPMISNVGYFIAGRLFHPGDALTVPKQKIEILAMPAGAPWMKISETIDYMLAVQPHVVFPIHDAVLGKPEIQYGLLERFADPAGVIFKRVENGTKTEY